MKSLEGKSLRGISLDRRAGKRPGGVPPEKRPAPSGPGLGRFFCENCGTEVGRSSGRCPSCGRVFANVRCPRCGFSGEAALFSGGCPVCGYCAPAEPEGREKKAALQPDTWPFPEGRTSLVKAGKLPLWVYLCAVLGFVMAAVLLLFSLR